MPADAQVARGTRAQSWASRAAGHPLTWIGIVGFMFTWPLLRSMNAASDMPPEPPVLGTVPEFSLVDQLDEPLGTAQLKGRVWIASFTHSGCHSICPEMMERMRTVQHRVRNLGNAIKLVTLTVQPGQDNPDVFAAYASKQRASPRMWGFATGAPDQVEIVMEALGVVPAPQTRFFLIDGAMRVRGSYDMSEKGSEDTLIRDAGLLINRGG